MHTVKVKMLKRLHTYIWAEAQQYKPTGTCISATRMLNRFGLCTLELIKKGKMAYDVFIIA